MGKYRYEYTIVKKGVRTPIDEQKFIELLSIHFCPHVMMAGSIGIASQDIEEAKIRLRRAKREAPGGTSLFACQGFGLELKSILKENRRMRDTRYPDPPVRR